MAENTSAKRKYRGYPWFFLTQEEWMNSQFSIARFYGRIRIGGHTYVICDRKGRDVFALSVMAHEGGKEMAIEPGEPADLVLEEFIPVYRKLGRDGVFKMLEGRRMTLAGAYRYAGIEIDNNKNPKTNNHERD